MDMLSNSSFLSCSFTTDTDKRISGARALRRQVSLIVLTFGGDKPLGSASSDYRFALSDWFEAPIIHGIERRDRSIWVQATDNIKVTKVRVTVLDEAGKVIEQGGAVHAEGDRWEFPSQTNGTTLQAEAGDLAHNKTKFVV